MVKTGLEILTEREWKFIKGKRIGLVANQTSITADFCYSLDTYKKNKELELVVIFSPEHGFYGAAQDMVPVKHQTIKRNNKKSSVPIISLYGEKEESLKPHEKEFDLLDTLIFDIQDIGSRYYTYIYTMSNCMEACAEYKKMMVILDRPNPINGIHIEGPILEKDFSSFVGRYPILSRHGMTSGELAHLFNNYFSIGCNLEVIKMDGWKREMWFDETGIPWIPPSPNMPTLDTAIVYPGSCLFEGTNLSEGRGTCRPFEWIGAPWINADQFAETLNGQKLPGVYFRPIHFTPQFHKWKDEICKGIHIHITDRNKYKPVLTGVAIVASAFRLSPAKFKWREDPYEFVSDKLAFDLLAGSDKLREQIISGMPLEQISASWNDDCSKFQNIRKDFLLY